jgi:hypothetical protein
MIRYLAVISLCLAGCASPPPAERHQILGTTYGWEKEANNVEVLLDAKINKLLVRHVKLAEPSCVGGFVEHIEISGEIGPDSTEALGRLLPQVKPCTDPNTGKKYSFKVYLSSGGGYLNDGYALGDLFREHQVGTEITGGQKCASSCAIAFLGGKFRQMSYDAELLFHAPYTTDGIAINCEDTGQVAGLEDYYQTKLGETEGRFLLERTMSYCSVEGGWTLNKDGAKLLGITTN